MISFLHRCAQEKLPNQVLETWKNLASRAVIASPAEIANKKSNRSIPKTKEVNMKKLLLVLACSLSGCVATYQAPKVYDAEKERTYTMPYDKVWDKVVEWFALHATPVKNMDRQSGFIASDFNLSTSKYPEYTDCGTGGRGALVSVEVLDPVGNFNLLIRRIDDKNTKINITVSFSAKIDQQFHGTYGTSHDYKTITCNSKGVLEKELLDYIGK